ncbi:MAG: orotidine-5'-phosphate decarboxylase [Planctomycetes bacterium]|nr:orotidine-5'-phosphate decarboxylase [Planctomycetota bacterium]
MSGRSVNEVAGHFSDRLLDAIEHKGSPSCVGIDPVYERLPIQVRRACRPSCAEMGAGAGVGVADGQADESTCPGSVALDAICEYTIGVLDAVCDHVPAVKFQSACFERYRAEGVELLYDMIQEAQSRGLMVILDAKRGDIGISAQRYAEGLFEPVPASDDDSVIPEVCPVADAVTVNGYLGMDGIEPFCKPGHGVFVLIRTSSPGSDAVQDVRLEPGQTVAEHLATLLADMSGQYLGERGYSDVGAVVAGTRPEAAARVRALLPHSLFLVPGYGAQGGTAADCLPCFDQHGRGALITASRSVSCAFDCDDASADWADAVALAAQAFAQEVAAIAQKAARVAR